MADIYNSALKNGTLRFEGVSPTPRFEKEQCIGLASNLIKDLPDEIFGCDVIYCEPPFPAGIKVFDERAGHKTKNYEEFASGFARAWDQLADKPRLAITNKALLKRLSKPDQTVKVKLNKAWENLSCWNVTVPEKMSNLEVCTHLGKTFHRMGDLTCGYGLPLLSFRKARHGNTFVGVDYDPHCITVLQTLLEDQCKGDTGMSDWSANQIEMRDVSSLVAFDRNPRIHPTSQIEQIKNSIRQWGWTVPILIDESGMVLAGHGRLFAATEMDVAEVPCVVAKGWTDEQKSAYVIADNKLAENSAWDTGMYFSQLKELDDLGFDLSVTGLDKETLSALSFQPSLNPLAQFEDVTTEDVEIASESVGTLPAHGSKVSDVICPHCGAEFQVSGQ